MPYAPMLGRRLFVRIYLYQVMLLLFGFVTVVVAWRTLIQPGKQREEAAIVYIGEWALRQLGDPVRLHRELDAMNDRLGVRITIFTPAGGRLVNEGTPQWQPLDPGRQKELRRAGKLKLPDDGVAVSLGGRDSEDSYAMVALRPELTTRTGRAMRIVAILLVFFTLGTIPLVRSIAIPLEKLSRAAKAFGGGDLRARAKLNRRDEIGDVADAFDEMADSVEAFRRAEKELLANVSHELRTPLARIRVVLELAGEAFPEAAGRYVKEITEDLGELEQLVTDTIHTAQLDLKNTQLGDPYPPLNFSVVPFGSFVDALARRFSELHPDRPLEYRVDYEVAVVADKMLLKRAINNVLENAHKYSAPEQPISIQLDRDTEGINVSLTIRDQGIGIEAVDMPHVFTPFFRTDRSRARQTGGSGLGLSLARRIIEAHHGSIHLKSGPDEGTTVSILLPLDGDEAS